MKEEESANSTGNEGESYQTTRNTKLGSYAVIAILLLFIVWLNTTESTPSFEVEKTASITSWSVGATATESLGFFKRKKYSDLEVKILSTGVQGSDGVFNANDTLTKGSTAGIRIQVENVGKIKSAPWNFEITLPTKNSYVYTSPEQIALEKGDAKTYIFTFDKLIPNDSAEIKVLVETKENEKLLDNNQAIKTIEIY